MFALEWKAEGTIVVRVLSYPVERVVKQKHCCGIAVWVCEARVSIHLVLELEPEYQVARSSRYPPPRGGGQH